jgi:hypothetical protein
VATVDKRLWTLRAADLRACADADYGGLFVAPTGKSTTDTIGESGQLCGKTFIGSGRIYWATAHSLAKPG